MRPVQRDYGQPGPVGHSDHGGGTGVINPAHHAGTACQQFAEHPGIHVAAKRRVPHPGGGGYGHLNADAGGNEPVLAGVLQRPPHRAGNLDFTRGIRAAAAADLGIGGYAASQRAPRIETQGRLQGLENIASLNVPAPGVAGLIQGALADRALQDGHAIPYHAHRLFI